MRRIIELTEDLLTGIPEMDEQHRKLVDLLNEVYELSAQGKREEAREKLISGIISYVHFHFDAEEEFMSRVGFPECELHKQIHANFRKQMLAWAEEAKEGDEQALRGIAAMIWAWFLRHIGVRDRAYGEYCRGRCTAEA
ncbi:hemerythrin family protein [Thermoflexus sp.]|uniref:bacteriohemerythrin n=1 Tax=Thermoflexus sp. TaxID=1969742 RepID=UPI002ADE7188|nr:hemerythrin family protein [Thermoflexus sp.]